MRILGMGVPEFIVILAIIILLFVIFGPKNLPKLGTAVGKTVKNLKAGLRSAKKHAVDEKPVVAEIEATEAAPAADAAPATVVADIVEEAPAAAEAVTEQVGRVPETAADRAEAAFAKVESAVAKAEAAASQADADDAAQAAPRTVKRVVKRIN